MHRNTVEGTIDRLAAAWSQSEKEFLPLFTDDCLYEDMAAGARMEGKQQLGDFYRSCLEAFPDFSITLTSRLVDGSRANVEWIMTGTHLGKLREIAPTHNVFSVRGASVIEFDDGKIKHCTDYYDGATMYRQIGI